MNKIIDDKKKEKILEKRKQLFNSLNDRAIKQAQMNMIKNSLFGTNDLLFNDNDLSNFESSEKNMNLICDKINETIDETINNDNELKNFKILLYGKAGTGKTYTSILMMNTLLKHNKTVYFINMNTLKELIYNSFSDDILKKDVNIVIDFAKRCDVLIIDDLGTESSNSNQIIKEANEVIQQKLYDISNFRINKNTIITSNHDRNQLERIYNKKIISRLFPEKNNNENKIILPINFNYFKDKR